MVMLLSSFGFIMILRRDTNSFVVVTISYNPSKWLDFIYLIILRHKDGAQDIPRNHNGDPC